MSSQEHRRRLKFRVVATTTTVLLFVSTLSGCRSTESGTGASTSALVEYVIEVDGMAKSQGADVTMVTADGGISQRTLGTSGVVLAESFSAGSFVSVSAQSRSELSTVRCQIVSDGKVISSNESSGDYVIVSCEGQATPCPECVEARASAEAEAEARIPYGFVESANRGVYFRILEEGDPTCGQVTCVDIEVVADRDCPKGFVVLASQLNPAGAETGSDSGSAKRMVRAGDPVTVSVGWESNPQGGKVLVESISCLGND